ncbi:MAG: Nramp family divalent metal transporter, partial [Planctomycetaceae bacterium]|nr:Nramp family divalent metal transporter [Planctomycetaceae bacterium]
MGLLRLIRERFGPAIIIAAVVLGPGSILTSSKVGCQYGYAMLWVILGAAILMIGSTALSARLGASLDKTLCGELAEHLGRPVAAFIGIVLFLVVAGFQSSNNLAVIAAIEPYISSGDQAASNPWLTTGILLGVNLIVIAALFGMKQLYAGLEKLMITLMTIMVIGFGVNLLFAQPSIRDLFAGLIPSLPDGGTGWLPQYSPPLTERLTEEGAKRIVKDPYWAVQGMTATTFSIAGAFYQAYLVKEKGWTKNELSKGLMDSVTGIAALGLTTMMIMCTAAAVLHGNIDPTSLKSVTDVAGQLKPLFGDFASTLFVLGLFAGAFSSFLVNAAIGGVLLA